MSRPQRNLKRETWLARLLIATLCVVVLVAVFFIGKADGAKRAPDVDRLSTRQLASAANRAIRRGHVYSHRWGDASPWLRSLCYELVERAFAPYGTEQWALYVVNRESGCNPGAINSSSGTTGIAQIHPAYHQQFDYWRMQHDMRYALATFLRLSHHGRYTDPWRCSC